MNRFKMNGKWKELLVPLFIILVIGCCAGMRMLYEQYTNNRINKLSYIKQCETTWRNELKEYSQVTFTNEEVFDVAGIDHEFVVNGMVSYEDKNHKIKSVLKACVLFGTSCCN